MKERRKQPRCKKSERLARELGLKSEDFILSNRMVVL